MEVAAMEVAGANAWAEATDEEAENLATLGSKDDLISATAAAAFGPLERTEGSATLTLDIPDRSIEYAASADYGGHGSGGGGEEDSEDDGNSSNSTEKNAAAFDDGDESGEGEDSEDESLDFADAGDGFADVLAEDWSLRHRVSDGNELDDDFAEGDEPQWAVKDGNELEDDFAEGDEVQWTVKLGNELDDDFAEGDEPQWTIKDGNELEDDFAEGDEVQWTVKDGNEFDDDFAEGDEPQWKLQDGNEFEDDFAEGQWEPSWNIATSSDSSLGRRPDRIQDIRLSSAKNLESGERLCFMSRQPTYSEMKLIESIRQAIAADFRNNGERNNREKMPATLPTDAAGFEADALRSVASARAYAVQGARSRAASLGRVLLGEALSGGNYLYPVSQISAPRSQRDSYASRHPHRLKASFFGL
jgi:hypothetical protein